jgi:hypothetical protein
MNHNNSPATMPRKVVRTTPDTQTDISTTPQALCPACSVAPAQPGSEVCDFCTAKRERLRIL